MLFCLCAVAVNYWIRFRYLNTYAQLKEPPLPKSDAQELHPDVNTTETPPAFHTYLDEFLQAVRIFGFLEKPVRGFSQPHTYECLQPFHRFFMN